MPFLIKENVAFSISLILNTVLEKTSQVIYYAKNLEQTTNNLKGFAKIHYSLL